MSFNIRGIKRALGRSSAEPPSRDAWKQRAERRAARITELEATIADLERRLAESRRRVEIRRRTAPNPEILRDVLGVRASHFPALAADRAAAASREAMLAEASAAYRAAAGEVAPPILQRTLVDGLPWWIPLDERVEERIPRAQQQGFPLRAILQTREVAIGGVMLDLGANIGRTSVTRVLLGDVRVVYAAEPEPGNYACLTRNVIEHGLRGFVLPDQVAIGAERGDVQLRVSRFPGGHRVVHRTRRPVETVTVPLWPVDLWIERLRIEADAVTFVKVDTQGSEVRVLRGARALLARPHVAWQIEVDPKLLKRARTPVKELFDLIETHFTHFIDLGVDGRGPRQRPTRELRDALAYVGRDQDKTDLVLYQART